MTASAKRAGRSPARAGQARNVLVTGGAGYIGSHACKALAKAGYLPVAFDNLCYGHEWAVRWGPLVVGDILDRAALNEALGRYRPCAVMHFAAFAHVEESVGDPAKYYRNNVAGTLSLLEAMVANEIERLVFSSTCAIYGVPATLPIEEGAPLAPINPYGASKLMTERMLADFGHAHGLTSVALRYFNAAGADPEGEIGEDHTPETHLVPRILDAAAGLLPHITIFGDDYETPDGTCIRDYIHVADLAKAHVLALEALSNSRSSTAYNLGNGKGFSVREVVTAAERVTGREIAVRIGPRRPGDPPRLVGDAARARRELGWKPQWDTIEAIVETAWAWKAARLAEAPARRHAQKKSKV